MNQNNSNRPKIGLALSGGSGRAIAHIGVIETLKQHGIPIDIITACSSSTLVAASYACGTMEKLKADWVNLDKKYIFNLLSYTQSGEGLFSSEKFGEWSRQYINRNFEEVEPRLGFVAVDIVQGTPEVLMLGDMVRGLRASCAVPGLLEPVRWGNKILVDGGLFSVVPIQEARDLGADIVIGVDIAATRHVIKKPYLRVWQGYNYIKESLPLKIVKKIGDVFEDLYKKTMKIVFYSQSDFYDEESLERSMDLFSVLGRAMDLVNKRRKSKPFDFQTCDIMLSPKVKHFGKMNMESSVKVLDEGSRVTLEAIVEIEQLISHFNWRQKAKDRLRYKKPAERHV